MRNFFTGIWMAAIAICILAPYSQARTAYVSDMLILTFREGPGTNFSVLQTLKSNTPMTIVEEKNGFYKVTLGSGDAGWVDKQFVVFDTPKSKMIEILNREKTALENQLATLTKASARAKNQIADQKKTAQVKSSTLENQLKTEKTANQRLSAKLKETANALDALKKASQDILGTMEKNKTLAEENQKLNDALSQLKNKTSHLFRTGMIKWFLAGVGVLLLGWILGQSVSSKRKRSSLLD